MDDVVPTVRRGRPGYDQRTVLDRAVEVFNRQGYDATSMGDLARELGLSKSAIYHHVPSKEHLLASALEEALDALSQALDALAAGDPLSDDDADEHADSYNLSRAAGTHSEGHGDSPDVVRGDGDGHRLSVAQADTSSEEHGDSPAHERLEGAVDPPSAAARLRAAVRVSVQILVDHLPAVTLLLRVRGNSEVELAALQRRRELDDRLAELVRDAAVEGSLRDDLRPELVSRLLFGMVNSAVEWYRPGGAVDAALLADTITRIAFDGLTDHR